MTVQPEEIHKPLTVADERERSFKQLRSHLRGLEMAGLVEYKHLTILMSCLHKLYYMAKGEYKEKATEPADKVA